VLSGRPGQRGRIRPVRTLVDGERTTGRAPEGEAVAVRPVVVVAIAVVWVVVLGPPLVRSWLRDRRSASAIAARPRLGPTRHPDPRLRPVGDDPAAGRASHKANASTGEVVALVDRSLAARAAVRCRRRNVLFALVVTVSVTAVGGFGWGSGVLIAVNIVADGFLVLYVFLLVRARRAEERRAMWELWSRAA